VVKRQIYGGSQGVPDTSLRYDGALPTVLVSICYQFTGARMGYPTPVSATTARYLHNWYQFDKVVKQPIYGGSQGVPELVSATTARYLQYWYQFVTNWARWGFPTSVSATTALPTVLVSILYQFTGARRGYPTPVSAMTARYLQYWYQFISN